MKGLPQDDLYLVHVTSVGSGREILESDVIEARYCLHFDRHLVYFFLDRPGYKLSESDQKSDQINRFPFVFVVPFSDYPPPFHVYPFDTGAALKGLFDERSDPFVYLQDYELGKEKTEIQAHLRWAFGSRPDYFRGHLKADLGAGLAPWQAVENSFLRVAQAASPTHNRPDKRASAVEVAYDVNFPVSGGNMRAVVPKQLLEWGKNSNTQFIDVLNKSGVTWRTYDWSPNSRPGDFFTEISDIIESMILGDD
jgi:hypothetical protein